MEKKRGNGLVGDVLTQDVEVVAEEEVVGGNGVHVFITLAVSSKKRSVPSILILRALI